MNLKTTSLVVALLALLAGSCTKKYETNVPYVPPYHVDGIQNFSLSEAQPFQSMFLSVIYENGRQEPVTLSLEGVPSGLHYEISTPSGYPSFSSMISFFDSSAATGKYKINLVVTGSMSGRTVLPFTVDIVAPPECGSSWTGNYSANNFCASGPSSFTENVTTVTTKANRIRFNNFENSGQAIFADLNCTFQSITIPNQVVGGFNISGEGDFFTSGGQRAIRITYFKSPVGGGSGFTCTETMFQ